MHNYLGHFLSHKSQTQDHKWTQEEEVHYAPSYIGKYFNFQVRPKRLSSRTWDGVNEDGTLSSKYDAGPRRSVP